MMTLDADTLEAVVLEYELGAAPEELALAYEVSVTRIRNMLARSHAEQRVDISARFPGIRESSKEEKKEAAADACNALDLNAIRDEYAAGSSIKKIAADNGVSYYRLLRRLKRNGIALDTKNRQFPQLPIEQIASEYRCGKSLTQLAAVYGACATTIRMRLIAHGVKTRGRGRITKPLAVHAT